MAVSTLWEALDVGAASEGRFVFVSDHEENERTVRELHHRALRHQARLHALGIGPGDPVAVQAPNGDDAYAASLAVLGLGATLVPLVPVLTSAETAALLRACRARALLAPRRWRGRELLHQVPRDAAPHVEAWLSLDEASNAPEPPAGPAPRHRPTEDRDATCLILFTSGTTGRPKGVRHTHRSLLAELGAPRTGSPPPPTRLGTFPAGHMGGVLSMLRPLIHGGTSVVLDRWHGARAARMVERHRVVAGSGTPLYLRELLDEADAGADISSLRFFLTGAANVAPSLVRRAADHGVIGWRAYGSTEHPTVTSCGPRDPEAKRIATDGRPTPGNEVRICEPDTGRPVATSTDGEIQTRGRERFAGYLDPADDAAAFTDDGWFRTGDIGHLDADGYLVVTDRLSDVIIRGGENISSKEVEDVLATHPAVVDAAVVAAPDRRLGEIVCCVVQVEAGADLGLDDVAAHVTAQGLSTRKAPERLIVVEDFPRAPTGKIRKDVLRDHLRRDRSLPHQIRDMSR